MNISRTKSRSNSVYIGYYIDWINSGSMIVMTGSSLSNSGANSTISGSSSSYSGANSTNKNSSSLVVFGKQLGKAVYKSPTVLYRSSRIMEILS